MNETSTGIDQVHARTKPIERVDEGRDFGSLELEHPADQDGTPDMRRDQPHLPARMVVDGAVALVAEDSEYGRADRGPVDDRADEVDEALRFGPLAIQFTLGEFCERHQIGGGNRLFEVAEKMPFRGWIDLSKKLGRQRHLKSGAMGYRGVMCADILAEKPASGAADKVSDSFDGILPARGIDGRVVNDADQVAELLPVN
ncbi:MAG: hypothetical protein ABJA75_00965 [Bradyrhizobium sp.]